MDMSASKFDYDVLHESAHQAEAFLKALANRNRLLILCHLVGGEMSVGELEDALNLRQPTLSQQLARLRDDGLVATRRESKNIFYSIANPEAEDIIGRLYELYCSPAARAKRGAGS